jgi:hypothetical protein
MSLEPELNLAELQEAFARWRETRRPRQIPAALGANAVALLGRHRTNEILRALGIDHRTLMRWKRRYGAGEAASAPPPPAFVALAPAPVAAVAAVSEAAALTLTLSRQAGDGAVWSLAGTLTPGQWRAALALLAAEVTG